MTMSIPLIDPEPAPLMIATTKAEGRFRAMVIAGRCEESEAEIRLELAEEEGFYERSMSNMRPEMRPGMLPRIYREALIAGLQEALAVVDEMKQRGEEEDLGLALGRRQADAQGSCDAWLFATEHWKDLAAIEAKIVADRLGAPMPPEGNDRWAAHVFPNYYTMAMLDGLRAALEMLKALSPG